MGTETSSKGPLPTRLQGPGVITVILVLTAVYFIICGTLSFALGPAAVFSCILLVMAVGVLATEKVEQRHPAAPCLTLLIVLSTFSAAAVGIGNYHQRYAPYLDGTAGRSYNDVTAASPASAYADGSILRFNNDTLLDTTRALGLLSSDGSTYCVAPILSTKANGGAGLQSSPRVEFWAVGTNCCARRADFRCDSAGELDAGQALVVHDVQDTVTSQILAPRSHYDEYLRAVAAASALHGLTAAEPPVLVRWTDQPQAFLNSALKGAIVCWLCSTLVACVILVVAWVPLHKLYDEQVRRAAFALHESQSKGGSVSVSGQGMRAGRDPFLVEAA